MSRSSPAVVAGIAAILALVVSADVGMFFLFPAAFNATRFQPPD